MGPNVLADTGALLAFLDPKDPWHERCVACLAKLRLPLATTNAVLTELFHFRPSRKHLPNVWAFLRSGAITVMPLGDADLPAIERLMLRYADRPMDYADATLVHLAERESITTVFTVDHNDFETYRIRGRKRFRIVPGRG